MSHYTEASQHTWVWMNNCMRSLIFLGGSALAVVPHLNRIKTECFCECRQRCRASVGVEVQFVEFSPSVENSPKWSWGVFLLLCEVGYLPRSVTWVTRHFMWPLSLWMKTTPSPASVHRQKVDKQLLPGNQNWLPYCCFESPHFPPLPLLISSIVIIDVDISIIFFFFFATTCIKFFLKSVPDSCPQPVLHFLFRLRATGGEKKRCRNRWCHGKEKGTVFFEQLKMQLGNVAMERGTLSPSAVPPRDLVSERNMYKF